MVTIDAMTPSAAIMPKPMSKYAGIGTLSESQSKASGHQSNAAKMMPNRETKKPARPTLSNLEALHLGLIMVCASMMLCRLTFR